MTKYSDELCQNITSQQFVPLEGIVEQTYSQPGRFSGSDVLVDRTRTKTAFTTDNNLPLPLKITFATKL